MHPRVEADPCSTGFYSLRCFSLCAGTQIAALNHLHYKSPALIHLQTSLSISVTSDLSETACSRILVATSYGSKNKNPAGTVKSLTLSYFPCHISMYAEVVTWPPWHWYRNRAKHSWRAQDCGEGSGSTPKVSFRKMIHLSSLTGVHSFALTKAA